MFYVYVLKSLKKNWKYIGSTRNLKKRIRAHNDGSVKSTKHYKPLDLIYYEAYVDYSQARTRELELKNHGQKKEILWERLEK